MKSVTVLTRSCTSLVGRSFLLAALVVSASGCSLLNRSSDKPSPADLGENVAVLGVRQAWTAQVGKLGSLALDVHASKTAVTLASEGGEVAAIDARTGGDIWRTSLGEQLSAGVGSDGKFAAVVSRSNELIVLNAGKEVWRRKLTALVFTRPLVAGGRIFVLTADRSLSAYDAGSGATLWSQQRPGDSLVLRHSGVLIAVDDTLVAGFSGRLVGVSPDNGSVRWEAPIATARGTNDVERLVELVGRTSRAGASVCARAFQAAIGCVSTARGSTAWTQPAAGVEGIDGDEEAIFGAESNGTLLAFRRADGSRLWTSERLKYRKLTAPLLLGRSVVVGDSAGVVHLVSRSDGSHLNRMATDGTGIGAAPVVAADTLVVVTRGGGIFAFRPE